MEKTCEECGREFPRPKSLSVGQWEKQRYCSRECSHLARRKRSEQACLVCGKSFYPYLRNQKFCSWECAKVRPRARGADRVGVWKGGRSEHEGGYIRTYMPDEHPFVGMRGRHRYVLEHRLVMAESLGRVLRSEETVHHKNGDRSDNRIENLELRVGKHGKGATHAHCPTCTCFED